MRKRKRTLAALFVLAIAVVSLVVSLVAKQYYTRAAAGADVFVNGHDAYVFACENRQGWRGNYIQSLGVTAKEFFGVSSPPTDFSSWLRVARISSTGIQVFSVEGTECGSYTAFGSDIYISLSDGLHKWVDSKWQKVSEQERDKFSKKGYPFSSDWTRVKGVFPDKAAVVELPLQVDGRIGTLIAHRRAERKWLDVRLAGQNAQTVFSSNEASRHVSKTEYESIFHLVR